MTAWVLVVVATLCCLQSTSGWQLPSLQHRSIKRNYRKEPFVTHNNAQPLGATLAKNARPYITLDEPIVPAVLEIKGIPSSIQLLAMVVVTVLLSRALQNVQITLPRIPISYSAIEAKAEETIQSIENAIKWFKESFIPDTSLGLRVLLAKASLSLEKARRIVGELLFRDRPMADLNSWSPCVFESRQEIMGKYTRYRFQLSDKDTSLPLFAGQELILCSVDNKSRMLKQEVYPVSDIHQRGYFDVIVMSNAFEVVDERFAKALEALTPGDELAFKGGKPRLVFSENFAEEIKGITLFSAGLGITSSLQILRHVLSETDTTVEQVDLVWLNDHRKDFVLEKEVETLELRHFEKFVTTKILDKNVLSADLLDNTEVLDATPSYTEGQVAIVSAPQAVADNISKVLLRKGYPRENIVVIETVV